MSARAHRHVHACAIAEGTRVMVTVSGRHLCVACRQRRPRFRHRGVVKCDPDHTLCFECHRALRNQVRVRELARRSPFVTSTLRTLECAA
jgi:hypothetical protein